MRHIFHGKAAHWGAREIGPILTVAGVWSRNESHGAFRFGHLIMNFLPARSFLSHDFGFLFDRRLVREALIMHTNLVRPHKFYSELLLNKTQTSNDHDWTTSPHHITQDSAQRHENGETNINPFQTFRTSKFLGPVAFAPPPTSASLGISALSSHP